ncbi:phage integrase SAM-like domain-containing protein [Thalassococcus sp. S3]|uniref:phage integrase SAM-like domain-containing protein n=1 Tax=Thalassococcus sp. S3 TaxID=2017482 RepID=UPI0020C3710D|nr:phage integrase SAM-like domain-containing protein [Thalassococcus sp. S3]
MLKAQANQTNWPESDRKLLYRQKDGLLAHFGKYDVTKITNRMVREYFVNLDASRKKPLAASTKHKHVITIRKVLSLAVEDGLMKTIPLLPKQKTVDNPRHAVTDQTYKGFMKAAHECVEERMKVRGVTIRMHYVKMFKFVVHSFLRPTEGELFGIKHKDMTIQGDPAHLEMVVHGGKTGLRTSVTMPLGVLLYRGELPPLAQKVEDENAYVWMPEYPNRTTAINTATRIFNHILERASLVDADIKLSPYSLRHYALRSRLQSSNGKVNIYTLAKNAGTSVDQLERFYLKSMSISNAMIENLHSRD